MRMYIAYVRMHVCVCTYCMGEPKCLYVYMCMYIACACMYICVCILYEWTKFSVCTPVSIHCICIYVYMCMYILYEWTKISVCMYVCTYCKCMYVCKYVCIHCVGEPAHLYAYTCRHITYVCKYICVCVLYDRTNISVCTHMYVYCKCILQMHVYIWMYECCMSTPKHLYVYMCMHIAYAYICMSECILYGWTTIFDVYNTRNIPGVCIYIYVCILYNCINEKKIVYWYLQRLRISICVYMYMCAYFYEWTKTFDFWQHPHLWICIYMYTDIYVCMCIQVYMYCLRDRKTH